MRYKLHRVAGNSEGWLKPSMGRLGQMGFGEYVCDHGFGHEDWNFNLGMAANGQVLGYTVARPSRNYLGEKFGLILATYDAGGWRAVGYYNGAIFSEDLSEDISDDAYVSMAADVYDLAQAGHAHNKYIEMTFQEIERAVRNDFIHFCWKVPIQDVHVFGQSHLIPERVFNPGKQRMITSYNIDEHQFRMIAHLGPDVAPAKYDDGVDEGARKLRTHKLSERDRKLISDFKARLTSFACSICDFDFGSEYGELGAGFIECHHTKPVAKMKPGDKTRLEDLRAVCANCHRMLHRSDPMLSPEELRQIIR